MWIPTNYKSPSASKDNEEGFRYKKKKNASKSGTKAMQGFKDFKEIKKLK